MDERLATAQEAAIGFAKRMRKDDAMEVIDFDSQVRILADVHQRRRRRSRKPSARPRVNGSTSLYNAIYISLKELKKVKARVGRRDPAPGDRRAVGRRRHVEPGRVRRGPRSREAVGDGDLRDRPAADEIGAPKFKEAEFVLRQLSQETGGRAFFPTRVAELPKIYQQISEELASQYTHRLLLEEPAAQRRLAARGGPR